MLQMTVYYPEKSLSKTKLKAIRSNRQITKIGGEARVPKNQLKFDENC
jgi:hypothetical protein